MKRNNINYTLVGAFVLIAMALLIYALARLNGHTEKHDVYYSTFSNVAGIADGSPVTFDGYQVGHVQSIEPVSRDGRIYYRVQLLFKHDWKVPADSSASISSSGLLSSQLIDVQQGKSQDFLQPGQDIQALDNPPLIAALGGLASDLRSIARDEVRPVLQNLNHRVDSLGGLVSDLHSITRDEVRPVLQNLNHRVDSLGGMLEHKGGMMLDQADGTLARLNTAAENLGQLLNAENRQHMSSILKNGEQTTERVNQAVDEFKQTETEVRYSVQQTQTVLSNLERASRDLNELSRQLRENPSSIFSSPAPVDPSEANK
jgi:phospholipid/cholesterol/gamma-HCH transport system substrate-binding protein